MNVTQHDEADARHRVCVIFAAGEYYAERPKVPAGAFVVAADGGYDHAQALGVTPDVIVGDFDSLEGNLPAQQGRFTPRTITLPALKDDPDMLSALKIGWAAGCRVFHIWGGLGGRMDHAIANIQLMALLAQRGAIGYLHGDDTVITAIADGELAFAAHPVKRDGRMVSVFSHTDVSHDVNEPGCKYELLHGELTNTVVQGVSNEFRDNVPARISVAQGTLIVSFPAECPMPNVTRFHEFSGDIGPLDTEVSALLVDTANA